MSLQRILAIPLFFAMEERAVFRIRELLQENNLVFNRPLVLSGPTKTRAIAAELADSLDLSTESHVCVEQNTTCEVGQLARLLAARQCDAVFAVGGGKVLDIAKMATARQRIPFVAVPTTLSSDGIASPIAVITAEEGHHESVGAQMPTAVLVDLDLVRQAPLRTLQAGVGDLVSNLSAVEDWKVASRLNGEKVDPFSMLVARNAAEAFLELVTKNGPSSLGLRDPAVVTRLAEGLLMSGLAMAISGTSRPCSGAEHLISHALDRLLPKPQPHGLQVGTATVFIQRLRGCDTRPLESAMQRLGVPTSMKDLGIELEVFIEALKRAPQMRPGRLTLLDTMSAAELIRSAEESYFAHAGH